MSAATKLGFHPDAASNFADRGEKLFAALKPLEREKSARRFEADRHPAFTLTQKDLLPRMLRQTVDPLTTEVSEILFVGEHDPVGLSEEHCAEVESLSEAIQRTAGFRPRISRGHVRHSILDWLRERLENTTELDLPSFVLERATDALDTFEVWVPIANLAVERDVQLDPVHVRTLSKEKLDEWYEQLRERRSDEGEDLKLLDEGMEKLRQRIQGLAAAVVTLRAEPMFAVEKGLERAEETAALFRLLHPANAHPHAVFYCRPLGREHIETHLVLLVKNGLLQHRIENTSPPMPDIWELSGERLDSMEEDLARLRHLTRAGKHSDFSVAALDAIRLYSRSTLSREPSDKLVFIFSALESLLLKDQSEPLQASVGDRLAFILGTTPQERKRITGLLRNAYGWRSSFVHHGRTSIEDIKAVQVFMKYVWVFFLRLPRYARSYQTKLDFINAIDNRKYT